MPADPISSASTPTTPEQRDAKGEWRPDYPAPYAPLFTWPMRIKALLKWLFGYPGYIWPTNLVVLGFVGVTWFYTQPELTRCVDFEFAWIGQIYLRNIALMWLYYGAFHLYLYTLKREGTHTKFNRKWPARKSRVFLFGDQVYDNIFWTCGVGGLVWTAYEVVTMWLYANGHIPWLEWSHHPVYFVLGFFLVPIWREFHFYWVHRLIHWKPLYKRVHYLHHKNVNPNPWSGMAMHPVETILYLSVVLIHWIVPSHPLHFLFNLQHAALTPANGHSGFEGPVAKGKVPTHCYFHYLHHRYFECNYGEATVPLDRWFGTYRDGRPDGAGSNLNEEHK